MGARFAVGGGRQGWVRTLLTAVGVALGVALLLVAASVPEIAASRQTREDARSGALNTSAAVTGATKHTAKSVLSKDADNRYHGDQLTGRLVQAEGAHPALPPGVGRLPGPGEMLVSPALKHRLAGHDAGASELRKRLDGRIVGTIGDAGQLGPAELTFYKGASDLTAESGAIRTNSFGSTQDREPLDPALLLLVVVACAVLVMPVAVFIATAVRFGGEQRDARLAALRLVGADAAMTRRIAAGESLVGTVFGLLLGGGLFLLVREGIGHFELSGMSVYPADVAPALALTLLIVIGVPVAAIAVTVLALRGVAIEPLGLVWRSEQRRRRLWWRIVPPAVGLALLLPMAGSLTGSGGSVDSVQVIASVVLLLGGVALLLPWVVERLVGRLRGGGLSWQLATRRLQLSSGNATRAVSGIAIAMAGAIALQMLFVAVQHIETRPMKGDAHHSTDTVYGPHTSVAHAAELSASLKRTDGVRAAQGYLQTYVDVRGAKDEYNVTVADCSTLRTLARVGDCHNGQVFLAGSGDSRTPAPHGGQTLVLNRDEERTPTSAHAPPRRRWQIPRSAHPVEPVSAPDGHKTDGVLATPRALPEKRLYEPSLSGWVQTDPGEREAVEHVRTALFHADPAASLFLTQAEPQPTSQFSTIQRAITAAAVGVLLLIGASMIVSQLEQLRERKRQLSVLVAFGTRRSTLGASVLWQTAIPVVLGIGLAVVFGLGLGWALLRLLKAPTTDWLAFLPVAGAGAGVIALVTLASLPSLWRMMRPDGLRTE